MPAKLCFLVTGFCGVDHVNNTIHLFRRPQGFVAGRLANLSPEQSSLIIKIYGVIEASEPVAPVRGSRAPHTRAAYLSALL